MGARLLTGEGTEQGWRVLKLVAVLYLAVLLGCTALINFSLGFILALTLVPAAVLVTPHRPKSDTLLQPSDCLVFVKPDFFFLPFQGSDSLHPRHPQPSLHTPFLRLCVPRTAGNADHFPGRLAALPLSHLTGDSGPLPLRFSGVPAHRPAGLSLLAAFLEYPFLEIEMALTELLKAFLGVKNLPSQVCLH